MPVDLSRVLRTLLRGKWWIIGSLAIGVGVGVGIAKLVMTNTYVSHTILKYDGVAEAGGSVNASDQLLSAKLQLLGSDPFLRKVKNELELEGNLSTIGAQIGIEHDETAGLVRLTMGGDTAEEAAENVNRLAQMFRDTSLANEKERLEEHLESLDGRVKAARTTLESARKEYDSFREEHGIADLGLEQQQGIASAAEMRAQSDLVRSEVAALEAKVTQLDAQLKSAPRTGGASISAGPERQELARLRGELAGLRGRLSEQHPQVQALEQQIQTLQLRIKTGQSSPDLASEGPSARYRSLESALSQARSDLEAAKQRQKNLSQLADEGQARVEEFSQIEGEASRLLAQVRVNEALLTDLTNRRALAADAIRHASSGFSVMTPGTAPDYPEPNKWKKIVALGVPGGLLALVILVLLFRELRGLRVRTAREVSYWGQGPVIGTTTWPRDPNAVQDLIADLDDYAPDVRGRMLVVGATEAEKELASELTALLNHDWYPTTLVGDATRGPDGGGMTGVSGIGEPMPALPSGGSASTALARRDPNDLLAPLAADAVDMNVRAWDGPPSGQALRRAARLADRVAVVVTSGHISALDLNTIPTRLGRNGGVGYILVGVDHELAGLPDRTGNVEEFWLTTRD